MDDTKTNKKYEAFKIPDQRPTQEGEAVKAPSQTKISLGRDEFYEIEYDSYPGLYPIKGVGKFVLKSHKVENPEKDGIRGLFHQMKAISSVRGSSYSRDKRIYDKNARQSIARIFYKQAMFMQNFSDDFANKVPFSSYFPCYQMLNYEQLRTYFTWRTQARKGNIAKTSLAYVFIYIYELLNNISVEDPQDGLNKLLFIWDSYRGFDSTVDKYVLCWLKDYHIYYNPPKPFIDFARERNLTQYYPKMTYSEDCFELYSAVSKYDIRKSAFFSNETSKLIADCFGYVIDRLQQAFENAGIRFDDAVFKPTKNMNVWTPFKNALFYMHMKQPDRRVTLSENEIYLCRDNEWTLSTIATMESGRQFIGYVMKQMESVLRKITKYRFKLTANINTIDKINTPAFLRLKKLNLSLDRIITEAVMEFYKETTKTFVIVDHSSLDRIRQEALALQEALTVENQTEPDICAVHLKEQVEEQIKGQKLLSRDFIPASPDHPTSLHGGWAEFKAALSSIELQALAAIARGGPTDVKKLADAFGVMLEVLAEGINEKAADCIGDNLLDEALIIYEDYQEQVKRLVEAI
ncbi:MAG: TerB N-terminal domain-containing protein [Clostridiales bacterium]|jgi:hypothetical protein|nr:TerB N-terminal domain-containing protein [Clostridiales bacterium]